MPPVLEFASKSLSSLEGENSELSQVKGESGQDLNIVGNLFGLLDVFSLAHWRLKPWII